jgi:DNA excision repair protein ERCC-8
MIDQLPLSSLLSLREEGRCGSTKFSYCLTRKRSRLERRLYPRLHCEGTVLSLDVCSQGQYLLTGNKKGELCIYDLSPWGGQKHLRGRKGVSEDSSRTHRPIQMATAPLCRFIVSSRWYPVDSGMFFSAARKGSFHMWDTNEMAPVMECKPFQFDGDVSSAGNISCMEISKSSLSIAVGSPNSSLIKLIDFRSGTSSHSLTGHQKGVCDLSWSPHSPYVLASGGIDSCVMLWDIRKAGSQAHITTLDIDRRETNPSVSLPFSPDGTHLRPGVVSRKKAKSNKFLKSTSPNNYHAMKRSDRLPLSHTGGCVGVSFDPSGHYLVSAGGNGDMSLWDLRGAGCRVPRRFVSSTGSKPVDPHAYGRVPFVVTPTGSSADDATIWTRQGSHLCGFSLLNGGSPRTCLKGHLGPVHAIAPVGCTGELISSAGDGMLLLWGPATGSPSSMDGPVRRQKRRAAEDQDDW